MKTVAAVRLFVREGRAVLQTIQLARVGSCHTPCFAPARLLSLFFPSNDNLRHACQRFSSQRTLAALRKRMKIGRSPTCAIETVKPEVRLIEAGNFELCRNIKSAHSLAIFFFLSLIGVSVRYLLWYVHMYTV